MPRSFTVDFTSPESVERVLGAFGDRRYWRARLAKFGGERTLDDLSVDADGTVRVASTEDLRHSALPGILTGVYRGDLSIASTEVWTPVADGRVTGRITVAVTGAPGSGSGEAELTRAGTGSRLALTGTIRFKVPLVGGAIETFLARQFAHNIPDVQRFTAQWLAAHP